MNLLVKGVKAKGQTHQKISVQLYWSFPIFY